MSKDVFYCKSFPNLATFYAYLDGAPANEKFSGRRLESETGTRSFTGTESYFQANEFLLRGDADSAEMIKKALLTKVKRAAGTGTKNRQINAVCGGHVNVPAMLVGLPKSMKRTEKIHYQNGSKVLSICYNNNASAGYSAKDKAEVSAALVSAVMALENKGYRINLYASCAAYEPLRGGGREYVANFVKVKDSGQYMDLKKLAYPLVNPSFQRRHAFRFRETMPGLKGGWPGGYGYSVTDSDTVGKLAKEAGLNIKKIVTFYELEGMDAEKIAERLLS